jgi:6-phosphofructokinase 1
MHLCCEWYTVPGTPEHTFDVEHLTELLVHDRKRNPSNYAVALISEGATMAHEEVMTFEGAETDQYGHRKLGGIGDKVAARLKELSPKFNNRRSINVVNQRLSYLVRCGDPAALDAIVPMAFGNLALELILAKTSGRLVSLRNGCYDTVPIDVVTCPKKVIDIAKYYNAERLRPKYETFIHQPLFIMTSDV